MKKTIGIAVTAGAILLTAAAYSSLSGAALKPVESAGRLSLSSPAGISPNIRKHLAKASAVTSSLKFYEDFESVIGEEPYSLPEGWISVSNPANPSDEWMAGGPLWLEGSQLYGTSGSKYAFILPDANIPHDTWMFTPAMELEEGTSYKMSANVVMLLNNGIPEDLDIVLCKTPSAEGAIESLMRTDERADTWTTVTGYINVEETGTYYLGFHALSHENSGGMVVDDVAVVDIMAPVFYGPSYIMFEDKYDVNPEVSATYSIWNDGYTPLEVSLKSCSPEITVEGLPLVIDGEESASINITLDIKTAGFYEGKIVFVTNDPLSPEVTVRIYQQVNEAAISEGYMTTFDYGTPNGFECTGNVIGRGIRASRAPIGNTFYAVGDPEGFASMATNYVNMGDAPRLSFWYKANKTDQLFNDLDEAAPADRLKMAVRVTDDYGRTWKEVYAIGPDCEAKHNETLDFQYVDIDLAEFAGKTCRAKIMFGYVLKDGESVVEILHNPLDLAFDNISFGTVGDYGIRVAELTGPNVMATGLNKKYVASVENIGRVDFDHQYTVSLIDKNGNVIATEAGVAVPFGNQIEIEFDYTAPMEAGSDAVYAKIETSGENIAERTESLPVNIAVVDGRQASKTFASQYAIDLLWAMHQPIAYNCVNSDNLHLYYADEIGINRGEIYSLVYKVEGEKLNSEPIQIYVGETLSAEFIGNGDDMPEDMQLVFDSEIFYPEGESELVIPFLKPYEYKGGNLVVRTVRKGREYTWGRWGMISKCETKRSVSISDFGDADDSDFLVQTQYPVMLMNMVEAPSGCVEGLSTSVAGFPLTGVSLKIVGEGMTATSDENGKFTFPRLAPGDYKISAYVAGYYPAEGSVSVIENETASLKIELEEISRIKVSGKVVDPEGNPVAGTTLTFDGETPEMATSDSEGKFEAFLYGLKDYHLTATSPFYSTVTADFSLETVPMNFTCTVAPDYNHPYNPTATLASDKIDISWEAPLQQLRHDTGDYQDCVGYPTGWSEIIFGSAYHQKATVREVSWYLSSSGGTDHSNFNVFVFGLTDGKPDKDKILYRANDVDFTNDAWNTHVLSEPIEADGFMVAVSCTGFMGIGYTQATEDYPYTPDTEYFAGDSYRFTITEIGGSSFRNCHWMLRAGIEPENSAASRPEVEGYKVYRYAEKDGLSSASEIGETGSLSFSDGVTMLPEGRYKWAIVADYAHGHSDAVSSPVIYIDPSSVVTLEDDEISISYVAATSKIIICGTIEEAAVYNTNGVITATCGKNAESIDVSSLPAGIYTVVAKIADGSIIVKKIIR